MSILDSYKRKDPFEYSFECESEDYLDIMFSKILNYYNGIGSGDFIFNNESIYRRPLDFLKYHNSTVLILGGGPTTKKIIDNNLLPKYDYVWSVNHFYLNNSLPPIDLAVLGKEPNKFDLNLINYIKQHNTNIVFEEAKDNREGEDNIQKLFPDKVSWYNTRYQSKLGIGTRIIIYAILLGVKNIYFSGIDGFTIEGNNDHAFEKNKSLPKWGKPIGFNPGRAGHQTYYYLSSKEIYELMQRQYEVFWEYIKFLQNLYKFKITNLGEKYPKINQLSKITKV